MSSGAGGTRGANGVRKMSGASEPAGGRTTRAPLIIVGFDLSPSSEHALAYAAGLAVRMRARLLVTYVTTFGALGGLSAFEAPSLDTVRVEQSDAVRELAEEILCDLPAASWDLLVAIGETAGVLERLAVERDADVIVVGRSRAPARHILGSVPARLVRHAACPITVVP